MARPVTLEFKLDEGRLEVEGKFLPFRRGDLRQLEPMEDGLCRLSMRGLSEGFIEVSDPAAISELKQAGWLAPSLWARSLPVALLLSAVATVALLFWALLLD